MRQAIPPGRPVVLKVGSSSLAEQTGGVRREAIATVADHVMSLWDRGNPTILVTSGAVAAGLPALGLTDRPRDLPGLQVAAAVGQGQLMASYTEAFAAHDRSVGQVLITRDVLARRDQYLHAKESLHRMLSLGVVPIVNENDTVVVDELRFGDNDRLAAIVSHLVDAGMLILLTDTKGLFSEDPAFASAQLLNAVRATDQALQVLIDLEKRGKFGSGGPSTKVAAAQMAAWSGIPTVVAETSENQVAYRALSGEEVGTWVAPREAKLSARKLWIAFGLPTHGRISIDAGASTAVVADGRSLLAVGVTAVDGRFGAGAAVEVATQSELIAKGLVAMSSDELEHSRGKHSEHGGGIAVHRDDLVVLS